MIGLLIVAVSWSASQGGGFDAALEAIGRGRFTEALVAAAQDSDPVRRRQAAVHTRHHAGDLRGALNEAAAGLAEVPGDPWLLEQAAFLAVSLNEGPRALVWAEELVQVVETRAGSDDVARARARDLRDQAREAAERTIERGVALGRAKTVAGLGLLGALLALTWFSRPLRG